MFGWFTLTLDFPEHGLNEMFTINENKNNIQPRLKNIGFPSPDRVYRKRAGQETFFTLIPEKKFFNHKYFLLAKFSLESKVNFLFFLLHHFFNCSYSFVHIVHTVLCTGFTRLHYTNVQYVQTYTLCLKWE